LEQDRLNKGEGGRIWPNPHPNPAGEGGFGDFRHQKYHNYNITHKLAEKKLEN